MPMCPTRLLKPAACRCQMPSLPFLLWFNVLLNLSFHFSLRVQRAAEASQPRNCSLISRKNMITFTSEKYKKRQAGFHSTQVPTKKNSLPRTPAPLLRSTSVPWWQAHFRLLSKSVSSEHTHLSNWKPQTPFWNLQQFFHYHTHL